MFLKKDPLFYHLVVFIFSLLLAGCFRSHPPQEEISHVHHYYRKATSSIKISLKRSDEKTDPIVKGEEVTLKATLSHKLLSSIDYTYRWILPKKITLKEGELQGRTPQILRELKEVSFEITVISHTQENQFLYFKVKEVNSGLIKKVQFNTTKQAEIDEQRRQLRENLKFDPVN